MLSPSLHRAAVLERMPVIEKTSLGHINGELAEKTVKEIQPAKLKQGEPLLPLQPANQVTVTRERFDWWPCECI